MKKIIIISLLMCTLLFISCGSKEKGEDANTLGDTNSYNTTTFKYRELSPISPLAVNSIVKYSNEYTSAPLYEWSDNVVLPIPAPVGVIEETPAQFSQALTFSGVTFEAWNDYVELLKDNYDTLEHTIESNNIYLWDDTYNFKISIKWSKEDICGGVTKTDIVTLRCFMGNQENNTSISTKDVLEKVFVKLDVKNDDKESFEIFDVSSHSNIKSGYWVYYLSSPNKTYLAIMQEKNLVGIVENSAFLTVYNEKIEFIISDDVAEMYILSNSDAKNYPNLTGFGDTIIEKYVLKDDYFEFDNTINISDIEYCKDYEYITMKKNSNSIELYELVLGAGEYKLYSELWSVGNKLGTLE